MRRNGAAPRAEAGAWWCKYSICRSGGTGEVSGATATIRPLELVATTGASPVKVLGVYLIGPTPPRFGPLVLYTPYYPRHVLKEYDRESDVLEEISRPGPLQDWVIQHVDATHQVTYKTI